MDNLYRLFFKAFSNQTRFEIINSLRRRPKNVLDICSELGFEQSRVSHNLKCLVDCGFVDVKQNRKSRIYSLDKEVIEPLLQFIDNHTNNYKERLKKCKLLYGKRN